MDGTFAWARRGRGVGIGDRQALLEQLHEVDDALRGIVGLVALGGVDPERFAARLLLLRERQQGFGGAVVEVDAFEWHGVDEALERDDTLTIGPRGRVV